MPHLGGVDGARGVVEPAGTGTAGHEHLAVRQHRGIHLTPSERHRAGKRPCRTRLVQVDDLGSVGRWPPAHVDDLARLVHERLSEYPRAYLNTRGTGTVT